MGTGGLYIVKNAIKCAPKFREKEKPSPVHFRCLEVERSAVSQFVHLQAMLLVTCQCRR